MFSTPTHYKTHSPIPNNKFLFDIFQERVSALYHFRDHYFENHNINDSINRNHDIEIELQSTLELFNKYKGMY